MASGRRKIECERWQSWLRAEITYCLHRFTNGSIIRAIAVEESQLAPLFTQFIYMPRPARSEHAGERLLKTILASLLLAMTMMVASGYCADSALQSPPGPPGEYAQSYGDP